MGHNQYGFLDLKGCMIDLLQMNTHTVVPVVQSSRGYGFFWNNPARGRVEFANNGTTWIAEPDRPARLLGLHRRESRGDRHQLREAHRLPVDDARLGHGLLAVQAALPDRRRSCSLSRASTSAAVCRCR